MDIGTTIGVFFWGTASMAMVGALVREFPEMNVLELVGRSLAWPHTLYKMHQNEL